MQQSSPPTTVLDFEPSSQDFQHDVLEGLKGRPKRLPSKYFYDERGSRLFDRICKLQEYYPTATELAIMREYGPEMAEQIGTGVMLVEFGSGSSVKTRVLLDHLPDPVAYVPVDISRDYLQHTADRLALDYRLIEVLPVCVDFTQAFELPIAKRRPTHAAVYFPGSTIGNFQLPAARELLTRIAALCGTGGGLLIGIDLRKDRATLEAAYNDSEGVTAEFNLNLLRRINRNLGGDFDLDQFDHLAFYNEQQGRIEMHLVSQCDQVVSIRDESFDFAEGETICTEYSHKYTIDGFAAEAARVGLTLNCAWTDRMQRFAVLHLVVR